MNNIFYFSFECYCGPGRELGSYRFLTFIKPLKNPDVTETTKIWHYFTTQYYFLTILTSVNFN